MTKELLQIIKSISGQFSLEWKAIAGIVTVETPGNGFDETTGKILIQFEPVWYRRKAPYAPSGLWSLNKVERQAQEWKAFSDAFKKNPEAAMEATSIGLGQIMGFHWKRLGYKSVGAMWDDAKKGLDRQVWQICQFILTDPSLQEAINNRDWTRVATIYNGPKFRELALKNGWVPYDVKLANAYKMYSSRYV